MSDPRNTHQMFDIDMDALTGLRDAVEATNSQMMGAYNRALKRTALHMHRVSVSMILESLAVKKRKTVTKRVQKFIKKRDAGGSGELSSVKLWYGMNPFRIHELRGAMKQPRAQKQPRDPETGHFLKTKKGTRNATFIPKGAALKPTTYDDSFVAEHYGYKAIWIRKDERAGIREARVPVADLVQDEIDEYIADAIGPVFMRYFEQDLRGRVAGNVHVNGKGKRI